MTLAALRESDDLYYAIRARLVDRYNWLNSRMVAFSQHGESPDQDRFIALAHQRDAVDLCLSLMAQEKRKLTRAQKSGGPR